jgi:membrane-associated phospholipid phosphatase
MIRLISTSWILLTSLAFGFAQTDTSIKRSDSVAVDTVKNTVKSDTVQQKSFDAPVSSFSKPQTGSEEVYKLNLAVDIPLTAVAAGWSLYAFPKIYDKPGITPQELNNLKKENINGFDRWAADVYHENAAKNSDMFFFAAIPLPLVLLIDREIRKDALKVGFMYLEAMSVTGVFYTGCAYIWDRFRPLTYIKNVNPLLQPELAGDQKSGNARNSFLGGHPALVATSSFFVASVYADYHPDSKFKYVLYGVATVVTGGTVWLRHRGGKHFPSDLIVGTTIGTLSGLLVPRLHKNKAYSNSKVRIMPYTGESHGLHMVYKL